MDGYRRAAEQLVGDYVDNVNLTDYSVDHQRHDVTTFGDNFRTYVGGSTYISLQGRGTSRNRANALCRWNLTGLLANDELLAHSLTVVEDGPGGLGSMTQYPLNVHCRVRYYDWLQIWGKIAQKWYDEKCKREAKERAEAFLCSLLSPDQKKSWVMYDFIVEGKYTLDRRGGVQNLTDGRRYCIVSTHRGPEADVIASKLLLLRADEERFLRSAYADRPYGGYYDD